MAKEQKFILGIPNLLGQSVGKMSDSRIKGRFRRERRDYRKGNDGDVNVACNKKDKII